MPHIKQFLPPSYLSSEPSKSNPLFAGCKRACGWISAFLELNFKKPTNRVYGGASFVDKKYTLNYKKNQKSSFENTMERHLRTKTHWIPEILVWGYVTSFMDKIVCAAQSETPSGGESLSKLEMKYGNPDWKMCNSTQI